MSSTWEYKNDSNNIIKRIFCSEINSNPVKYKWMVVLNDNLHVRLEDGSLDKLNLTTVEKNKLLEARINAKNLLEKTTKLYFELL